VQLHNSFLKFAFPLIWRMSSKYSTKQHTFAQLPDKQMGNIWYKNIHSFLRYRNFRVGTFFRFTLYTLIKHSFHPTQRTPTQGPYVFFDATDAARPCKKSTQQPQLTQSTQRPKRKDRSGVHSRVAFDASVALNEN